MLRIMYDELLAQFERVLLSRGFSKENAFSAAKIFADNSLDGVYSHGINRFPRVVDYLDKGEINPNVELTCSLSMGAIEQYDGHRGFGPLNAQKAMNRACDIANEFGIGLVALGNNNHWMRGGTYGRIAAERNCIGICWSNTMPNMPAWGGKDIKIGNNPLILAVPKSDGNHVVVDCALSQFSYGKIEEARLKGQMLSVPGGYDEDGNLSTDPAAIEKTWRVLPMGYWKGSGISILLDLISTVLTNANSVQKIGTFGDEIGLSQIMIAIDASKFQDKEAIDSIINDLVNDIRESEPVNEGGKVMFPGERVINTRKDNLQNGIPVIEEVWNQILNF